MFFLGNPWRGGGCIKTYTFWPDKTNLWCSASPGGTRFVISCCIMYFGYYHNCCWLIEIWSRQEPWCHSTTRRANRKHTWSACSLAGKSMLLQKNSSSCLDLNLNHNLFPKKLGSSNLVFIVFFQNTWVYQWARLMTSCTCRKFMVCWGMVFLSIAFHLSSHRGHPHCLNFYHPLLENRSIFPYIFRWYFSIFV